MRRTTNRSMMHAGRISPCKPSDLLRRYDIDRLYHFTHVGNLPSILRSGGLLSHAKLENRSVDVRYASDTLSRNLDRAKNLDDYVRLSFVTNLPMYWKSVYRHGEGTFVWLEIDANVIDRPQTLVSTLNATDNFALIGEACDIVSKIPLGLLAKDIGLADLNDHQKRVVQAEVLVKEFVPLEMIMNFDAVTGGK
ncbi:hypothetical protein HCR_02880 [Hydrogenimonas cancrithermarum]|uniref:DarT domain-containing protein n=1 Tax=Hydrogenimonas cancrithermarum TaxID=2993563 RepID=A0ABN6WSC9_9BACT|nr:hypothetical protein HCR_02880 [Hydrogenimonas cancrithermarum]